MQYVIYLPLLWNLFVFLLYGIDKRKAQAHKHRISEKSLILPAFFLGATGAIMGMIVFNHKTSKTKFRICIPLAYILNVIFYIIITTIKGR